MLNYPHLKRNVLDGFWISFNSTFMVDYIHNYM